MSSEELRGTAESDHLKDVKTVIITLKSICPDGRYEIIVSEESDDLEPFSAKLTLLPFVLSTLITRLKREISDANVEVRNEVRSSTD